MKTLDTQRLILRDWKKSDLDDFYEYAKVEGVGEMAGWPHHTNKEVSKTILDDFIKSGEVYAIVLKENNKIIGSIGIHTRKSNDAFNDKIQREIGYVLSKDYWGKGLIPEALNAVINYAFEDLGIEVLWCGHFDFNNRSRRVIEKCGFKFHSNGKYEANLLNKTFDEKIYLLTKDDYFNSTI